MRRRILAFVFAAAILIAMAVPLFGGGSVYADDRGPCNDSGLPGNSDYAAHHIVFHAKNGTMGSDNENANGNGQGHSPGGVHQGFSACLAVHS